MKCRICRQKTNEFLISQPREKGFLFLKWKSSNSEPLCRLHLIERFKQEFLQSAQKMVVVYPNLEEKHGNYQYYFATLDEQRKGYAPDKEINANLVRLVQSWLKSIEGRCRRCTGEARVAYFDKGKVRWKKVPGYLGVLFDYPMIQDVKSDPEILCLTCAYDRIEQSLRTPFRGFEDGVMCPFGHDEGIYITVEV